jgi:chromosome segregation ATPase
MPFSFFDVNPNKRPNLESQIRSYQSRLEDLEDRIDEIVSEYKDLEKLDSKKIDKEIELWESCVIKSRKMLDASKKESGENSDAYKFGLEWHVKILKGYNKYFHDKSPIYIKNQITALKKQEAEMMVCLNAYKKKIKDLNEDLSDLGPLDEKSVAPSVDGAVKKQK